MTVYANLEDGQVRGVYDLIPKFWNGIVNFDVQCRDNEEFMNQNGFVKIVRDTTPYDPATHRMSDFPTYTVVDNQVIEHREITPHPEPEPPSQEELLAQIRSQRDQLMADFEWRYVRYDRQVRLGLPTTDSLADMDQYMQALADITSQPDLENIVWPTY
jgi:hypothetical protein